MKSKIARYGALALILGGLLLLGSPAVGYEATVVRVIDGDTILLSNGEKVRYIGINTPEIHHPTRGKESYGEEAKEANRRLVEGKTVRLEFDVQQRDKYGRLLAYVHLDGQMVNRTLVREGYAEVATYPPNVRHQVEFVKLQREAREQQRGLWQEPEARKHYIPRGSGVVGRKSFRVYYHPQDSELLRLSKEDLVYFESPAEANAAGYVPSVGYGHYRGQEERALVARPPEEIRQEEEQAAASRRLSQTIPSGTGFSSSTGSSTPGSDVKVRGYYRSDGTYVAPHTRSAPRR